MPEVKSPCSLILHHTENRMRYPFSGCWGAHSLKRMMRSSSRMLGRGTWMCKYHTHSEERTWPWMRNKMNTGEHDEVGDKAGGRGRMQRWASEESPGMKTRAHLLVSPCKFYNILEETFQMLSKSLLLTPCCYSILELSQENLDLRRIFWRVCSHSSPSTSYRKSDLKGSLPANE